MSYSRFVRLAELCENLQKEETKIQLIHSAFIAHQLGAAKEKTFGEYLTSLGLMEPQISNLTTEQILEKSKKIREKAKKK